MHHDVTREQLPLDRHEAVRELLTMAARLLQEPDPSPGPSVRLSPGEVQLLTLLVSDDTGVQIAERLGVTINTLKTRLKRLYRKLGVTSREGALAVARRRGLVADSASRAG